MLNLSEPGGTLRVYMPRTTIYTVATGHLSASMTRQWIAAVDPHLQPGARFHSFNDWEGLLSYESTARKALTSWAIARYRFTASAHFLVASRVVAMGVSTASLAAAIAGLTMRATTVRREFELERAQML